MQRQKYQSLRDETLNLELARIALLEDGWYDGYGTKYAGADLDIAGDFIDAMFEADPDLESPWLVPDPDGDLRAEWQTPYKEGVLIMEFKNGSVWGHAVTEIPMGVMEATFPIATGAADAATWLRQALRTEPRGDTVAYKEEGA